MHAYRMDFYGPCATSCTCCVPSVAHAAALLRQLLSPLMAFRQSTAQALKHNFR